MTTKNVGDMPSLAIAGAVATIQFNRPEVHNRFQVADLTKVRDLITQVNNDLSIRVLIFTGTGPTFSSGFDLREFKGSGLTAEASFEALTDAVEYARPITIARIQGPVYGGATDLVLACDFKIAIEQTVMFMPAAKIGLHYYPNGIKRWQSRLGLQTAKRLFLTAEKIDGLEMLRIGFIDELVAADQLDVRVSNRIQQLLSVAPQALEDMKKSLNECARGEFDHARLQVRHERSQASKDMAEALAAIAEKRTPTFTRT
jgi:enoyl-CoA hydratase